ncbi:MAG: hypothetical protein C0404_04335 [Verrucomicrobia bacterium]|nr:hypothetical protein [Verrucomicrobiota bacterium]
MKSRGCWKFAVFMALLTVVTTTGLGQGSLVPPPEALSNGVPVSVMKSIDQVEPRKIIDSLPYTITQPGSYYLVSNLTGQVNAHGIIIACNDVRVDLGGFALNGVSNSWNAIHVSAPIVENLVVRNGLIRGWGPGGPNATTGFGLMASNAMDVVISDLKAFGNACGGLYVGDNAMIDRCAAYGNGYAAKGMTTPLDSGIQCGYYGTIKDCKARGNRGAGIFVGPHSRINGCTSSENNADGIKGNSFCTIRDCVANMNRSQGITVFSMCRVTENTCCQNGFNVQGAVIDGSGTGIRVAGNNNLIEKNILVQNSAFGLNAIMGSGNLIVNNCGSWNASNNFNIGSSSYKGQVVQPAQGDITNSNPWTNFQFN